MSSFSRILVKGEMSCLFVYKLAANMACTRNFPGNKLKL